MNRKIPSWRLLVQLALLMGLLIPVIPSSSVTASNGSPRFPVKEDAKSYVLHYYNSGSSSEEATLRSLQVEEPEHPCPLAHSKPSHFPPPSKRKIMKINSIGHERTISSSVLLPTATMAETTWPKNTTTFRLIRRSHRHVAGSSAPDRNGRFHPQSLLSQIQTSPSSSPLSLVGNVSVVGDLEEDEGDEEDDKGVWRNYAASFPPGVTCRHREDLPPLAFQMNTCAWCYGYIPDIITLFGSPSKKLTLGLTVLDDPITGERFSKKVYGLVFNGSVVLANISDTSSPIYSTFANREARGKWTDCCRAAERCCKRIYKLPQQPQLEASDPSTVPPCPATWDGWQCWPITPASTTAQNPCPTYIYFRSDPPSCPASVPKICNATGHWQTKEINGRHAEWTNYGTCASTAVMVQKRRAHVHVIAYAVSIIALIPAIILFFSYKQLRVHRIIIHQNFFLSLLINSVLVIAFKTFVILNDLSAGERNYSLMSQNGVGCRLLFILTKYSRLTNYMWMFCEGYYLHKLIAAAFAEQKSLLVFYLIGWVFPLIPTVAYAVIRVFVANDRCWVIPQEAYEWVLNLPSLLSLLVNFGFLINIIRVLVTKLRATHTMEQSQSQYRKAVRATLVLLPLFGTHFVVTIYRPPSIPGSCEWIELYYYVDYTLDGLQGFLVALIFCYVNGEVVSLVKRSYSRWKEQRSTGGCQRQQSRVNVRSNGRGRSVVSTHYSSVPASPEPGSLTRLTITHNNEINRADPVTIVTAAGDRASNGAGGGVGVNTAAGAEEGRKFWLTNGKPVQGGQRDFNSSSADEDTEVAWTDIRLGPSLLLQQKDNDGLELRQNTTTTVAAAGSNNKNNSSDSKTAAFITSNNATLEEAIAKKNGIVAEHQL